MLGARCVRVKRVSPPDARDEALRNLEQGAVRDTDSVELN